MKKSGASHGQSEAELISKRIAELGDWSGETRGRMRKLITEADPDVVEEWKWMNPVWAHDGIICTGESYKKAVKLIRPVSSTRASTETYAARSTSTKEKKLTRPPSRRWFAKRSPSTVLSGRNLRRKRSDASGRVKTPLSRLVDDQALQRVLLWGFLLRPILKESATWGLHLKGRTGMICNIPVAYPNTALNLVAEESTHGSQHRHAHRHEEHRSHRKTGGAPRPTHPRVARPHERGRVWHLVPGKTRKRVRRGQAGARPAAHT